jgi:signal transduction histidine kinase
LGARRSGASGASLSNAIKYTPHAGKIELSLVRFDAQVVLRVRDNGVGIPIDLLPRIFDPFAQGEHAESEMQDGLGLGLVLVRGIVERHHGRVAVTSAGAGRGSEFTVTLPVAAPEQHPALESVTATKD